MKRFISILLLSVLVVEASFSQKVFDKKFVDSLWNKTVKIYLKSDLWSKDVAIQLRNGYRMPRDPYDAGHFLMVPLYAAFWLNNNQWQQEFYKHFSRFNKNFMDVKSKKYWFDGNALPYLYLTSEFIVLAKEKWQYSGLTDSLFYKLYAVVDTIWLKEPWRGYAWAFKRKSFSNTRDRVYFVLDSVSPKPHYTKSIGGFIRFVFAMAANLKYYLILSNQDTSDVLNDIVHTGIYVLHRRVDWIQDSNKRAHWIYEVGYWDAHPDNAYSGYLTNPTGKPKKPRKNITEDVSHYRRMPLWLFDFYRATEKMPKNHKYIRKLLKGLEVQFYDYVLVKPNDTLKYYLTTNYMDGWNGYYRFNYVTQEKNTGYGPYQLSQTIYLGWWNFLGTRRIIKLYKDISQLYPIPNDLRKYILDKTTRQRHPLLYNCAYVDNGLMQLHNILQYKLAEKAFWKLHLWL